MDENKEEIPNEQDDSEEPILLPEEYSYQSQKPPYILMLFLALAILTAFWKKFIAPKFSSPTTTIEETIDPNQ